MYEIFELNDSFVIRSMTDRRIIGKRGFSTLSKALQRKCPLGTIEIEKDGTNHISSLRVAKVCLKPPQRLPSQKSFELREQEVTVVEVKEDGRKRKPLHWRLLTNLEVTTFEDALRVVEYYEKRWGIECFHRILKSGYGIEKTRLSKRAKLESLSAILSIISWHIFWLYKMSRQPSKVLANQIFDDSTLKVLKISAKRLKIRINEKEPLLTQAILIIARLGGYLNRRSDPNPGMQVIWQGWRNLMERLSFMQEMGYG
jgi:hypothetical protein